MLSLDEALEVPGQDRVDLVRLDEALQALAKRDELQSTRKPQRITLSVCSAVSAVSAVSLAWVGLH